ncbi:MAG: hypothetical protein IE885_00265 [Campylobacterales bacterium]|nr:hypothetical protein [Campylobacterales bacterium]
MDLKEVIGLGVAGNFAHHLEQAGELKDFENIQTETPDAPKGIFPFYLPYSDSFLGIYPIGTDKLTLPRYEANAQVEPEIGILFDIVYDDQRRVIDLQANAFTTFNDCTIRKEGAQKISEKKNWGPDSKGVGNQWIVIDRFEKGGVMDHYHLCSYVKRNGVMHPYGVDAPLLGYSYFYGRLKKWLMEKMNEQEDFGPLENIAEHLKTCQYPPKAFISIGATAYADFGEKNYLHSGDEIYVIAYDERNDIADTVQSATKVILHQKVQ